MKLLFLRLACLAAPVLVASISPSAASIDIDGAFKAFWAAPAPQDAARAIPDIVKSGVGFGEALRRLKEGARTRRPSRRAS